MSDAFVPAHIEVARAGVAPLGTALVLHGILGSASNWRGFVRRLVDRSATAARLRWILVDLRAHGDSALLRAPSPHTVEACAGDLARLATALGVTFDLVIGHSFGGKVALRFAQAHSPKTRAVWFLDTPPGAASQSPVGGRAAAGLDEIKNVLAVLENIPLPVSTRGEVSARFLAHGLSEALAQWMTTNLRGTADSGYRWKFELGAVRELLADYAQADVWPVVESPRPGLAVHGVRGADSDRFSPSDLLRLASRDVQVIAGAGHWLHVDAPAALAALFDRAAAEILEACREKLSHALTADLGRLGLPEPLRDIP